MVCRRRGEAREKEARRRHTPLHPIEQSTHRDNTNSATRDAHCAHTLIDEHECNANDRISRASTDEYTRAHSNCIELSSHCDRNMMSTKSLPNPDDLVLKVILVGDSGQR
jgi:hypothetical protein